MARGRVAAVRRHQARRPRRRALAGFAAKPAQRGCCAAGFLGYRGPGGAVAPSKLNGGTSDDSETSTVDGRRGRGDGGCGRRPARAADTPGVTATEIKIGNTMPYSGPVSSYSPIGKLESAFFKMVNEQGGVAGHQINFISLDDGYSPPKTVEDVRRLVEEDQVAFLFNTLGTPTNSAIVRYVNQKKVPHLFVATGAAKWGDYKEYPWTTGFQPDYRTEAQIYAKYILQQKPNAKIAVLYQNDDFGKDYLVGLHTVFGDRYAKMATEATYEPTDPTIDSQIAPLQASGADVLVVAAAPKFARAGDPQGLRPRLEADVLHDQRVDFGRVGADAGRAGKGHRHDQHRLPEGPDRPSVGQRRRHEGMAGLHGQKHARRRSDRRQLRLCAMPRRRRCCRC